MTTYWFLRGLGTLALRWFYRDVEVIGAERLPGSGPVLLASNHPNALVDALVIGCTLRRQVTLTAKATLLESPITRALIHLAGVVPLRRARDAAHSGRDAVLDPSRNAEAFEAILDVLEHNGVVLLFPEGKSHSDPALAPLKTGLARIAMMARTERHLACVPIVPIGLIFDRKWEPRSRILMHIGTPLVVDGVASTAPESIAALMQQVDIALRQVTLNFQSSEEARRVLSISSLLAEVLDEFRPLGTPDPPLANTVRVAQRIAAAIPTLAASRHGVSVRVEEFLARIDAFEALTHEHGIVASDITMSTHVASGAWFALREVTIGVIAGPLALWGRVNHWLPLRIARSLALRTSRTPDEPATHTIVSGLACVVAFYIAQIWLATWWLGWAAAAAYGISLPLSATWDFRYADRVRRGAARVRTYLRFRREPGLHQQLLDDLAWLRHEAHGLDSLVDHSATSAAAII